MARTCTICLHPDLDALNKDICNNVSYRNIALRVGTSATTVLRHIETCLKLEMSARRQEQKTEQAFNFEAELHKLYGKATKITDALEEWLSDPDNPDSFDVGSRATEMTLIFDDYNRMFMGKPTRTKANLQEVLETIYGDGNFKAVRVDSKVTDHRKLYLDAFKTLNDRLEQIAKFYGLYKKDGENPQTIERAIFAYETYTKYYPDATEQERAEYIKDIAKGLDLQGVKTGPVEFAKMVKFEGVIG